MIREADPSKGGRRIGPWVQNGSRNVYDNPWIRVREDAVTRPDGSPGIYGAVEFHNYAIGVVALNAAGEIVLVGQHRYPLDYYSWEVPEGGCPKNAAPEEAAARELREETGLVATRYDYLGTMVLSNAVSDEVGHLYLARNLVQHAAEPEPTEVLQTRWIRLDEACREALEGRITDSVSCVALLRARHFLERENAGLPPPDFPQSP
jgi:8-oxo-dGTP pyrophosphatase MutT (NUDIX family)